MATVISSINEYNINIRDATHLRLSDKAWCRSGFGWTVEISREGEL